MFCTMFYMKKNNQQEEKNIVINIPTKLRYYLDPLAIIIAGIILMLAINYAFKLIS